MRYTIIYCICMIFSTIVEMFLAIDFYKAFYPKRKIFQRTRNEILFMVVVVAINSIANLQNNNKLNLIVTSTLYLIIGYSLIEGNLLSRFFHWVLLILTALISELIFYFLLKVSVHSPTNEIYINEFIMISSIIAMKLIEFIILTIIKQISKIRVKKISPKVFGIFIIVPVATLGIMSVIPYIRVGGDEMTTLDMAVLLFYLLLLCGNIGLFYIFVEYSQLQEQKMMLEVSQAKYEERRNRHNKQDELYERYKERIHDIKYYLKQVSIYLNEKRFDKIEDILEELKVGIYKEEKNTICANRFLNALLVDFKGEAEKNKIQAEIFVEAGFKIEYMKEIDITSMLGNLLDNALEAAGKCLYGKIRVELYMQNQGDLAVFSIENTYNGEIRRENNQFFTTKEEKEGHGIGLRNVSRLVALYNGYMQQDFDDNIYITTILIPIKSL